MSGQYIINFTDPIKPPFTINSLETEGPGSINTVPIVTANGGVGGNFAVSGDFTPRFIPGFAFNVVGSLVAPPNNGAYVVASAVFQGTSNINAISAVQKKFVLNGFDYTAVFTPGRIFKIANSQTPVSNNGYWIVASSAFVAGNTEIIVAVGVPPGYRDGTTIDGSGSAATPIVSAQAAPTNKFTVTGNQTAYFTPAFAFTVAGTPSNNGAYTVLSSTYNVILNQTIITVTTPVAANQGAVGSILFTLVTGNISTNLTVILPTVAVPTSVNFPDGDITYTLAGSTSLTLPGRGTVNYGLNVIEDMVHMLENFYNPTPPVNPTKGQLWYDSVGNTLKVYNNGAVFVPITGGGGSAALSAITPAISPNTIDNVSFPQVWNWELTADPETAFEFGEGAPSTGGAGAQYLVRVETLATSTANPFAVGSGGIGLFSLLPIENILVTNTGGIALTSNDSSGIPGGIQLLGGNTSGSTGGSITIIGGDATGGAAQGGSIRFLPGNGTLGGWGQTIFGASGNADGALYDPRATNAGNFVLGVSGGTIATTSTDGFLYIQGMSGTPTGIPTVYPSNKVPVTYDTTANLMYAYSSGAWQGVGSASVALSSLTAAVAPNTINNADNDQVWNWSLVTGGTTAFTITENAPSVGVGTTLFTVASATNSTAAPFLVTNQTQQMITTSAAGALSLTAQFGENVTINALNAPGAFGGSVQIFGGNAPAGGSVGIQAGSASNPAFGAGSSLLDGGASPAGSGATVHSNGGSATGGGSLLMTGGNATGGSGLSGGAIIATSGVGDGVGPGGALFLEAGNGSATSGGGVANLQGGAGGTSGGLASVIGGVGTATNAPGGQVAILGGAATDGNGGGVDVQGTSGTGTDRNGGAVGILAGNATGTGSAGPLNITSGSAGTNGAGGTLTLLGGTGGTGAGSGGTINIQGGLGTINGGGNVNITGGTGVPAGGVTITGGISSNVGASGGSVSIFGGTPTDGNGGSVSITGSDAVGTNRDGGSTFFGSGSGTGTGVAGDIVSTPGVGGYVTQRTTGAGSPAYSEKSIIARATTTNATITQAFTDGVSKQMVLPDNSTWNFEVRVVARRTDATDESFAAVYEGAIDRQVGVATTALVGGVLFTSLADDSAGAWIVLVDADTGTGALRVQVTGQVAKTINWTAFVKIVEVTN